MRRKHLFTGSALIAALIVAGCAAAVPGYSPPQLTTSGSKPQDLLTKPFDSGTVTAPGVYQTSEAEKKLDCRKLTGSMQIIMRRLDDSANRPVQSQASKSLQAIATPVSSTKAPLPINEEIVREKARLKAYNELLVSKSCKPLDIAAYR